MRNIENKFEIKEVGIDIFDPRAENGVWGKTLSKIFIKNFERWWKQRYDEHSEYGASLFSSNSFGTFSTKSTEKGIKKHKNTKNLQNVCVKIDMSSLPTDLEVF
jgi:hypothetical protein